LSSSACADDDDKAAPIAPARMSRVFLMAVPPGWPQCVGGVGGGFGG
jgi:hypothetical protein